MACPQNVSCVPAVDVRVSKLTIVQGALASCQKLFLGDNQITDVGLSALASACSSGALAQLIRLDMDGHQIGDAGMTAFAGAVGKGRWTKSNASICPQTRAILSQWIGY